LEYVFLDLGAINPGDEVLEVSGNQKGGILYHFGTHTNMTVFNKVCGGFQVL